VFPDILEPVSNTTFLSCARLKSLPTQDAKGINGCLMFSTSNIKSLDHTILQVKSSSAVNAARDTIACHSLNRFSHSWIWAEYWLFHFSKRMSTEKSIQNNKLKIIYIILMRFCAMKLCCSNALSASEALC